MDLKAPEGDDDDCLRRNWYDVKLWLYKWLYNVPPPIDDEGNFKVNVPPPQDDQGSSKVNNQEMILI